MKLPSKFINYKESSLYKFPMFLEALEKCDLSIMELYKKTKNSTENIQEWMEIMDCLYALGVIELREEVVHYAKKD